MLVIKIPMFGGHCYICYDKEEFIGLTEEEVEEGTLALVSRDKTFAMYLPYKDCLNHELIHLSWFILDFYGVLITVDNHECLTYLHDCLRATIEKDPGYQSLPETVEFLEP